MHAAFFKSLRRLKRYFESSLGRPRVASDVGAVKRLLDAGIDANYVDAKVCRLPSMCRVCSYCVFMIDTHDACIKKEWVSQSRAPAALLPYLLALWTWDADPIQCDVLYRCSESHNPDVASRLPDASHRVMLRAVRRVSRRSVCIAGNADFTPRLLDEFARCRGTPARGRCQYQSALGHLLR